MDKKIKCEMTEVSETKDLNDRDILNDVLLNLKHLTNNYAIMLNEMSNKKFFKDMKSMLCETAEMTRSTYELAFSKGWYELTEVDENVLDETYKNFCDKTNELA